MPYLTTSDGAELFYEQFGSGSPVVVFPGWTMTRAAVARFVPILAERHEVTVVEARAHGRSSDTQHGHRIARYGRDMVDALEQLAIDDAIVVGWSMAASTLLAYWEHSQGARARGLVFVDFSPRMINDADWALGFGTGDAATELVAACRSDFSAAVAAFVPSMFLTPLAEDDLAMLVAESLLMQGELAARVLAEHCAQDWTDLLSTITIPALVCHAEQSYFSVDAGRYVAEAIPNARFVLIPNSGHAIPWEQPQALADAIEAFARDLATGESR